MARLRTLKPTFFANDKLAELSPLHRLLFQGLWCQADREGRLEDRPRQLKAVILAYDDCDVDDMLEDLHQAGFILRYGVRGRRLIYIPKFLKHQKPHPKEAPSELPPPDGETTEELADQVLAANTGQPKQVLAGIEDDSMSVEPRKSMVEPRKSMVEPRKSMVEPGGLGGICLGDIGLGDFGGAVNPPPAAPEPKPLSHPPADPDVGKLRDALDAVFSEEKGQPYEWTHEDEHALRSLLRHPQEQIARRWRIGLKRTRWPSVASVAHLLRHWNYCAADAPKDVRERGKGYSRADAQDWSDTGGYEPAPRKGGP